MPEGIRDASSEFSADNSFGEASGKTTIMIHHVGRCPERKKNLETWWEGRLNRRNETKKADLRLETVPHTRLYLKHGYTTYKIHIKHMPVHKTNFKE